MEGWANTELLIVVALASFPQEGARGIGAGLERAEGRVGGPGSLAPCWEPRWLFRGVSGMELAGLCAWPPSPPWRRDQVVLPAGQFPRSSRCAVERDAILIFVGAFCQPQHLPEAFGCCLFQLLPAEGMHRDVPILFSPAQRPLLSWEQQTRSPGIVPCPGPCHPVPEPLARATL